MRQVALLVESPLDLVTDGSGKDLTLSSGEEVWKHSLANIKQTINYIKGHPQKAVNPFLVVSCSDIDRHGWEQRLGDYRDRLADAEIFAGIDSFERLKGVFNIRKPDMICCLSICNPFIPSALVNRAINIAARHRLDYLGNTDPRFRTMMAGQDVDVLSDLALLWLFDERRSASEKTRHKPVSAFHCSTPEWMRIAHIRSNIDISDFNIGMSDNIGIAEQFGRHDSMLEKNAMLADSGYGIYGF